MKLYKTFTIGAQHNDTAIQVVRWAGSGAVASKDRTSLAETYGLKRTQVKTVGVEFKQDKGGILEVLNTHANGEEAE